MSQVEVKEEVIELEDLPSEHVIKAENDAKQEMSDILCVDYDGSIKTISVQESSLKGDSLNLLNEAKESIKSEFIDDIQGQSRQTDLKKTLIRPSKTHF